MYVESDTLLLANVFENFRNECIEILELLTDIDMLLIAKNGIRVGICQVIHRYAVVNNKYMKNYDKNIKSSYLTYLDANNLYRWAISQKNPVIGFEWVKKLCKFDERILKNYDENSVKGYFLEVDVEYPKNLFSLHSDLPFLPERKKTGKCNKLVCDIYDKKNCVVHVKALKQALNHGLILKKVHTVIQFNQKVWLKPYIDMNTKLGKEAKMILKILFRKFDGNRNENNKSKND